DYATHGVGIASVRAGNVIGGGDWADDRLVPDIVRTILKGDKVSLRNPHAIRPWQYVLEPLSGYLMLAQRLYENGVEFSEAWNFGPNESDAKTVEWIVKRFSNQWGTSFEFNQDTGHNPHEANYLKLDSAKARNRLQWYPKWNIEEAIDRLVEWYKIYTRDGDTRTICLHQIEDYINN
ncbi:MAG: CDP-glucose 4,6-dehydratase, partial [Desulfitobacteriaceae bacterium]